MGVETGPTPDHDQVLFSTYEAGHSFRIVQNADGMFLEMENDRASARFFPQSIGDAFAMMQKHVELLKRLVARKQDWSPRGDPRDYS